MGTYSLMQTKLELEDEIKSLEYSLLLLDGSKVSSHIAAVRCLRGKLMLVRDRYAEVILELYGEEGS